MVINHKKLLIGIIAFVILLTLIRYITAMEQEDGK